MVKLGTTEMETEIEMEMEMEWNGNRNRNGNTIVEHVKSIMKCLFANHHLVYGRSLFIRSQLLQMIPGMDVIVIIVM